ncbi:MAG: hypothetical protein PHQ12_10485 [Chthoniobacteraceae bacterium]|nr:hypothetical protein [Chthoniobacteraceae bacterium]
MILAKISTGFRAAGAALLLGCALFTSTAFSADQVFDSKAVKIDPSGMFMVGGVALKFAYYTPSWSVREQNGEGVFQASSGFPKDTASAWETQGVFQASPTDALTFRQKIDRMGDSGAHVTYHVEAAKGATLPAQLLCLHLALPIDAFAGKALEVDGSPVALPQTAGAAMLFDKWGSQKLVIPVLGGKYIIEGADLKLHLQDERSFQHDRYVIWMTVAKGQDAAASANFEINVRFEPDAAPAK